MPSHLLISPGSSCSSHLYWGVYLPNKIRQVRYRIVATWSEFPRRLYLTKINQEFVYVTISGIWSQNKDISWSSFDGVPKGRSTLWWIIGELIPVGIRLERLILSLQNGVKNFHKFDFLSQLNSLSNSILTWNLEKLFNKCMPNTCTYNKCSKSKHFRFQMVNIINVDHVFEKS